MLIEYINSQDKFESLLCPHNVKDYHWLNVQVVMPNDMFPNGMLNYIDHSKKSNKKVNLSHYPSVWFTKYLGFFYKQCTNEDNEPVYFGKIDMKVDQYVKGQKHYVQISTLDHKKCNKEYKVQQTDINSCGYWTILDMLNRSKLCTT